jgi:hypothetical protein
MSLLKVKTKKNLAQSYQDAITQLAPNAAGELVRACHPYAVRLPIRMSEICSSLDHVAEVFIYSTDPNKVAYKAAALWNHWIRIKGKVKEEDYPKVATFQGMETLAEIVELDDGDYAEIWRAAKNCKHYKAGHPEFPVAFMLPASDVSYFK